MCPMNLHAGFCQCSHCTFVLYLYHTFFHRPSAFLWGVGRQGYCRSCCDELQRRNECLGCYDTMQGGVLSLFPQKKFSVLASFECTSNVLTSNKKGMQ